MSSAGQIIGGVVGGAIGFFAGGNVALGASIGMSIGGYIDPPKGPKVEGPRLSDTKQQTATYGAFITRTYGNIDAAGNVFYIENNALKEVSTTESQGGKGGGGGAETTTYSYYGTFAIGLCECAIGEAKQLGRIWVAGKLFYDPLSTDAGAIAATADAVQYFTFYSGAADQQPDDRMQAVLGVGNVPAYRGLCWIMFKDLPLADCGNSIVGTQVKVEILTAVTENDPSLISTQSSIAGQMAYEAGVVSIGDSSTLASAAYANNTWDVATARTKISYLVSDVFVPSYVDPLPNNPQFNSQQPGKYPWLTSTLYKITGGVKYGGIDYPFAEVSPANTKDWVIDQDGQLFFLYTGYLYKATASGLAATVAISADTMYLVGETLYVFTTGTTYVFDRDLNLVDTRANSLDMVWGSGDAYSWMAFGGDDGRIYFMECYGVYQRSVARLNSAATAIETQYAIAEADSGAIRAAIYVKNGSLIRAYVSNTNDNMTVERWSLGSLTLDTVPLSEIVSKECLSSGLLEASDIDVTALTQEVRGYKISSSGSIRSALEPLQASWPFDVVPSGYKIKFVPRGGASVATIDSSELDAREAGQAPGIRITQSREMDTQLPRRVEVSYIDNDREYDVGPPGIAERLNTDAINVEQIQFPIVLTAGEGAGKAETLLYQRWLDRYDLTFVLPPTRINLEAADVVTINEPGANYVCRLSEINYLPDGRLECKAKLASTTIYTPAAVGQAGLSTWQVLTYAGPSSAVLLDIPCVLDDMDTAGFPVAMYGQSSGWPGGVLARTDDGQTWTTLLGFSKPGSTVGFIYGAIGAGRVDIPDTTNVLQAYFYSGDVTSITESALFAGGNMFAYGQDGRWEIISVRTAADRDDGGKNLYNLYRGRFGTEWAMTLHQDGDLLVLLDLNAQQFISQSLNNIGQSRTYRAVTRGKSIDSASDQAFTYRGMNLECLAPMYLNGHRNVGTLDWTLTWTRRGRTGTEWRDYVDVPLGESSEAYIVEIWNDSSYTTLKRTINVTSASATYTRAQQVADFGEEMETLYVKVYQVSANVGAGIPLVATISRGVAALTDYLWGYVSSLLHFDLDSNNFIDTKSAKSVTVTGGAYVSDAWSPFGNGSGWFDGVNANNTRITMADSDDWHWPGAFTVAFRIKPAEIKATDQWLFQQSARTGDACPLRIKITPSGNISVSGSADNASWVFFNIDSTTTVAADDEMHIAVTDDGTTLRLFINGAIEYSRSAFTRTNYAQPLHIGGSYDSGDREYHGAMSDLFVLKGKAKWTAAFTVPSEKFDSSDSDWSYCVLSLPMELGLDNTMFFDQRGKVWTRTGSPIISAAQSKHGGFSGSFAAGEYISTPTHADFNPGSANFCIEIDAYWTTIPGGSAQPLSLVRKWGTVGNYSFDFGIYYEGSGVFTLFLNYSTTGSDIVQKKSTISAPTTGSFFTYSVDRNGNTLRQFVNGVMVGSFDITGLTIYTSGADLLVGLYGGSGAVGHLEEFRFTREGRYTNHYTVIAAPYPDA